jgi:hypothetical protein
VNVILLVIWGFADVIMLKVVIWQGIIQNDWSSCKNKKPHVKTEAHGESHVVLEGRNRGIQLKFKEHKGLEATARS